MANPVAGAGAALGTAGASVSVGRGAGKEPGAAVLAGGGTSFGVSWWNHELEVSFSAPVVSGIVALMLSVNPSLTPSQVKAALIATATPAPGKTPLAFDARYGYGTANAFAAVRAAATNQLFKLPTGVN